MDQVTIYRILVVCCICGKVIKTKVTVTPMNKGVSHGYCTDCYREELKKLESM